MVRQLIGLTFLSIGFGATAEPIVAPLPEAQEAFFSDDGYRIDRYRSPTPAKAVGAETVTTEGMRALLEREPSLVVIDVINLDYRADRFLQTRPHPSLPTAVWLPNTGQGRLDDAWHDYLVNNALALTRHNRNHPVVVLCKSDCWLSWNAVKRLAEAGFRNLYWYKDGVDGWANAGLPMQPATPVRPRFHSEQSNDS